MHFFAPRRNAAFVRTHRRRRATVIGRRRALQPHATGRSQHRLLQTPHDRRHRRGFENVRKGKSRAYYNNLDRLILVESVSVSFSSTE